VLTAGDACAETHQNGDIFPHVRTGAFPRYRSSEPQTPTPPICGSNRLGGFRAHAGGDVLRDPLGVAAHAADHIDANACRNGRPTK
jgi:hypothetical protein